MTHYYSPRQEGNLELMTIGAVLRGKRFIFFTGKGVFSRRKVDFGTTLLADRMEIRVRDRVLDMGCGIGVLGRVAVMLTRGEVVLVDVNVRAVQLARKNTKGCDHVRVLQSDGYEKLEGEVFTVILLNPPQTAGKKVCFQMIEGAFEHLSQGGSLQMVARHRIGGAVLSRHMEDVFGNVEILVKKGGYRVYCSRRLS